MRSPLCVRAIAKEKMKLGSTSQRLQVSPLPPVCNRAQFSSRKLFTMATSTSYTPTYSSLATTVASSRRPTMLLAFSVSVSPKVDTSACHVPTATSIGIPTGESRSVPGSSGVVVSASSSLPSKAALRVDSTLVWCRWWHNLEFLGVAGRELWTPDL